MRHLSRKYANRKSTLRNLATSLVLYERIKTTTAKAKELRPVVERLFSRALKNDLNARRYLLSYLFDENATKKVFEVLVPRFKGITSGFIKTYRLGKRLGDGADIMIVELVKGESLVKETAEKNNDSNESVKISDQKDKKNAPDQKERARKARKNTTKSKIEK